MAIAFLYLLNVSIGISLLLNSLFHLSVPSTIFFFLLRFSDFCVCLHLRLCLDRRLEAGGGGRFLPHEAPPTGVRPREGPAAVGVPPLTPFYKNLIIGTSPRNTPSDPTDKPVLQTSLSILLTPKVPTPKVLRWVPNQNICMCA